MKWSTHESHDRLHPARWCTVDGAQHYFCWLVRLIKVIFKTGNIMNLAHSGLRVHLDYTNLGVRLHQIIYHQIDGYIFLLVGATPWLHQFRTVQAIAILWVSDNHVILKKWRGAPNYLDVITCRITSFCIVTSKIKKCTHLRSILKTKSLAIPN